MGGRMAIFWMGNNRALPGEIKDKVSQAAEILLAEGCKEIYVLAKSIVDFASNVELATVGLAKEKFFSVYGKLIEKLHVDLGLIGLDYDDEFVLHLKKMGALIRVA
jgi:hypothetical protein